MASRKTAKKAAGRRSDGSSAARVRADLDAARAFAAKELGGAEANAKFGNAGFAIDGKVFAFVGERGLAMKLPEEQRRQVIATREAEPLRMGTRVMREWVLLRLGGPEDYRGEAALLLAAMRFVAEIESGRQAKGRS
jgi:hypothetical protein